MPVIILDTVSMSTSALPTWNTRMDNCVPRSPNVCAAMSPMGIPGSGSCPLGSLPKHLAQIVYSCPGLSWLRQFTTDRSPSAHSHASPSMAQPHSPRTSCRVNAPAFCVPIFFWLIEYRAFWDDAKYSRHGIPRISETFPMSTGARRFPISSSPLPFTTWRICFEPLASALTITANGDSSPSTTHAPDSSPYTLGAIFAQSRSKKPNDTPSDVHARNAIRDNALILSHAASGAVSHQCPNMRFANSPGARPRSRRIAMAPSSMSILRSCAAYFSGLRWISSSPVTKSRSRCARHSPVAIDRRFLLGSSFWASICANVETGQCPAISSPSKSAANPSQQRGDSCSDSPSSGGIATG